MSRKYADKMLPSKYKFGKGYWAVSLTFLLFNLFFKHVSVSFFPSGQTVGNDTEEQKNLTDTVRFLQGFQAVADDEILLKFSISFWWVVRVCLAGELIRQHMALCECWELIYEYLIYEGLI